MHWSFGGRWKVKLPLMEVHPFQSIQLRPMFSTILWRPEEKLPAV
jgi:hypothetical protein